MIHSLSITFYLQILWRKILMFYYLTEGQILLQFLLNEDSLRRVFYAIYQKLEPIRFCHVKNIIVTLCKKVTE